MSARRDIQADAQSAAFACAQYVVELIEQTLGRQKTATLAVSGGSTPKFMFGQLAHAGLPWERIHLFWVDERCVPPDDAASNYRLTEEFLIGPAQIPAAQIHRIVGEMEPAAAAARYAEEIAAVMGLQAGEIPRFDILHRGMGADGHTASLFPGSPLLEDQNGITGAVFAPQFEQWRVTLLPAVLLAAKETVLLVAGEDKAEKVRAVFEDDYDPLRYPVQLAARDNDHAAWFLDAKAAALLK